MLMTISHCKAGRLQLPGTDLQLGWRDVFRRNEDLLTGAIFSRFRFLSQQGLVTAMGLLVGEQHAEALGELVEIEFWPRLTGLSGRSWVEPDVLLTFEKATVLVEVKPPFGGSQSLAQWRMEVRAFLSECAKGERGYPELLHFVALGRNRAEETESHQDLLDVCEALDLVLHRKEWDALWRPLPDLAEGSARADKAVFDDWREAFSLFGIGSEPPKPWLPLSRWMDDKPIGLDAGACSTLLEPDPATSTEARLPDWRALFDYSECHDLEAALWN